MMHPKLVPIQWSDSMLVGHPKIDKQHKQLVHLFNKFLRALKRRPDLSEIRNAFSALVLYAEIHYKTEERLMEDIHYPMLDEHRRGHNQVLQELFKAIGLFSTDEIDVDRLVEVVIPWIPAIPSGKDDQDLADYIRTLREGSDERLGIYDLLEGLPDLRGLGPKP